MLALRYNPPVPESRGRQVIERLSFLEREDDINAIVHLLRFN